MQIFLSISHCADSAFKVGSLCVQDPFELDHNVASAVDSSRASLLMDLLQV